MGYIESPPFLIHPDPFSLNFFLKAGNSTAVKHISTSYYIKNKGGGVDIYKIHTFYDNIYHCPEMQLAQTIISKDALTRITRTITPFSIAHPVISLIHQFLIPGYNILNITLIKPAY